MDKSRLTGEHALYALLLAAALGLRLAGLGNAPLSDWEAHWALQALDFAQGSDLSGVAGRFGSQPAYIFLTGSIFSLLGSGNFLARLVPAIAGGSIVLGVYALKPILRRKTALFMAIGLAFSPLMTAAAREVSSTVLAVGFGLLGVGLGVRGKHIAAGSFIALAFLAGPGLINGLLGIFFAWLLARWLKLYNGEAILQFGKAGWTALFVTLLFVGTYFGIHTQGLAGWLATISTYLKGFSAPSNVPALRVVAALLIYEPVAVLFGLLGLVRAWLRGDANLKLVGLWFVVSLVICLLYPGRQVLDLVWVLIPLWVLAANELGQLLLAKERPQIIVYVHTLLIVLLAAMLWLNLAGLGTTGQGTREYLLHVGVIASAIGLAAITTILVGYGWTRDIARTGAVWGVLAALGIYTFSSLWGVYQTGVPGRMELWQQFPAAGAEKLLAETLGDLADWETGRRDSIDITLAVDSPGLRWALRRYQKLSRVSEGMAIFEQASVVLTPLGAEEPALAATYRGQDFTWWVYPGWSGALPPALPHWLVTRQVPLRQEQIVLWARNDLFPAEPLSLSPVENSATGSNLQGGESEP